MDITKLFCDFDDFIKGAEQTFKNSFPEAPNPPAWPSKLSLSEVVTILILSHNINGFRNLKSFYKLYIETSSGKSLFPDAVSYSRFVELIPLRSIDEFHEYTNWFWNWDFVCRLNKNSNM